MDDRTQRLHDLLGKSVHVVVDRPIGFCHKGSVYSVNYGYIPGMPGGDGEEQDAYILGVDTPLDSFVGQVVGAIRRKNDMEDKLIVAPGGMVFHQGEIARAVHFIEQYYDIYIISLLRKSCGVLPYRIADGKKEYLLVFEQYSKCWSLPKGHMEAGETEMETAQRELWEETGLTAKLDCSQTAVLEYSISPVTRKQVVIFPGQVSGIPKVRIGEIERLKWVCKEELGNHLLPDTVAALAHLL